MTNPTSQTNGASLEDCHTNFFSLTDVCGIKWVVLRASEVSGGTQPDALEDPVLASFSRCLEAGLLGVWRRVPRRALVTYSFDMSGNQVKQSKSGHDDKNQLSQCKELWLFWYGEKPQEQLKTLVNGELKEIAESSGSWETGIPYEARTLLFKALNNLIERSLLSKEFVRLGKWFVQPYDGQEKSINKTSHLSFSFQYFVHGESVVCTSVDVRQHPPVRRLSHAHLAAAASLQGSVQVVLAPYGMAATLTGNSYKAGDPASAKLLDEWKAFWPLCNNGYLSRDCSGELIAMPATVEVMVSGVRLIYPTSYVLVTDIDNPHGLPMQPEGSYSHPQGAQSENGSTSQEPSPFTASSHPLLANHHNDNAINASNHGAVSLSESVWTDALYPSASDNDNSEGSHDPSHLASWDYNNPAKVFKRKARTKTSLKKEHHRPPKFNSKNPFHRKNPDLLDELAWTLDQDGLCGAAAAGRLPGHGAQPGPASRVPSDGLHLNSPASVGPVTPMGNPRTPRTGPDSVKTPGDPAMPLLSPHPPLSNGPATPNPANPKTPGTPGGPRSQPPVSYNNVPSPFRTTTSRETELNKTEAAVKQEIVKPEVTPEFHGPNSDLTNPPANPPVSNKRPCLPAKDYEEVEEEEELSSLYDYKLMKAWLSHPVKKFRTGDTRPPDPLRPMYRRRSHTQVFAIKGQEKGEIEVNVKQEPMDTLPPSSLPPLTNGDVAGNGPRKPPNPKVNGGGELFDYDGNDGAPFDVKKENVPPKGEEGDLFSADGLKPSLADLDNMFEDSDNEIGNVAVPTPPSSVKPLLLEDHEPMTKLPKTKDLTGNLPHDQLTTMFPTPPSHEHPCIASPADTLDHDGFSVSVPPHVKHEPRSPMAGGYGEDLQDDDLSIMLASSKFAPLSRLYSDTLPDLVLPMDCVWKPSNHKGGHDHFCGSQSMMVSSTAPGGGATPGSGPGAGGNFSVSTPLGTPGGSCKPGLSPISPATSHEGPRSHTGPGSVGPPSVGAPKSVGPPSNSLASPASSNYQNKSVATPSAANPPPLANSLTVNLLVSDSLLNVHRDINFNSCTMCVCTNDGNIRGGESLLYLPEFAEGEDHDCKCGYSAVINRKLSHLSGMFLEDELEVTGLQEDVYFKKKPSLLLLDPKSQEQGEHAFNERAAVVDTVPHNLIKLIQQQVGFLPSEHSVVSKYSQLYLKTVAAQSPQLSMVEALDGAEVVWLALDTVRSSPTPDKSNEDQSNHKQTCLHKWPLLTAPSPFCSEDIMRVMKCLSPVLNVSLHVRKPTGVKQETQLSVTGPLTWRQFHRMAGVTTKGNTDDGCEPLPIPTVTLGFEREWMTMSPLSLYYWDSLSLEPWGSQRDVAYIVVAPDNDNLLSEVKTFFKKLSNTYELLRLGRHSPITKVLRDGIMKVGTKLAGKLEEVESDEWFNAIGDSQNATLLKLYSKVCRHYLVPHLSSISHDQSLLDSTEKSGQLPSSSSSSPMPPPIVKTEPNENTSGCDKSRNQAAEPINEGPKDPDATNDPLQGDVSSYLRGQEEEREPPAIVIYMVDPFSFSNDNPESLRQSCLGFLRCFNQMLPHISSETLRHSLYLQTISLDSIFKITGTPSNPVRQKAEDVRASNTLRNLSLSVYTQSHRSLNINNNTKTLTGFGPASAAERYVKAMDTKDQNLSHLYVAPYILAPPPVKSKKTGDSESFGASKESSTVLFVNYCLTDDQRHLIASLADDKGEMVKTTIINIDIPNRTRRKKASARRVGLRKLLDWILSVMAMNIVPWRLVIGRLGRIGHGELRGWSVLLSRKSLKKAVKQLKEQCMWKSDVPTILSVCLVSMEPDSVLRVMPNQYTPDERFGSSAAQCTLSTPKDTTATHILVFPTSATAQSSQAAFNDHQETSVNDGDLGFGLGDLGDIDDMNPNDPNDGLGLGDLNDIFNDDPFSSAGGVTSPTGEPEVGLSQPGSPGQGTGPNRSDASFKYGQEEKGDTLEILQQPLALGYLVSTAATGPLPRWFWAGAPHLENACPAFLKSALHINIANLAHGGDDGMMTQTSSGRVHSLDSNYTTDVLRYVLEGYNALSWLVIDPSTHDRRSCLPIHVQSLVQLYHAMAALV